METPLPAFVDTIKAVFYPSAGSNLCGIPVRLAASMSYTVLARKYRPQTFDDLVGQEHVARTLVNAIKADRVAHAFLFTGVRGVGKTSTARLLAKALNCEQGPTPTPCNECSTCKGIIAGVDVDVQEIDGASNNSVEDVRRLQESLPYRPQRDRFKIVIVDEVHMLSTGAFNAFLKTLEEPPEHVKFIFATTESHKVPITIRSRCQQYDFRLIHRTAITKRLAEILALESIKADDESLAIVSREAAGSMRDALTLLDQIVATCGNEIAADVVTENLGLASRKSLFDTFGATLSGEAGELVKTLGTLSVTGLDVMHFAKQLVLLSRDLVVLKLGAADDSSIDLVPEELQAAQALADNTDELELQRCFASISKIVDDMGRAADPMLVLEMGLVRIATRPKLEQVSALLDRLDQLEKKLGSGGSNGEPQRRARSAVPDPKPVQDPDPVPAPIQVQAPKPTPGPVQSAPRMPTASGKTAPGAPAPLRRAALQEWERLVDALRENMPALAAVLEHGIPRVVCAESIVLSFKKGSFYGRQAEAPEAIAAVQNAAQEQFGKTPTVEIRYDASSEGSTKTVAAVGTKRREAELEARRREALNDPCVQDVIAVFPESAGKLDVHVEERGGE